MSDVQYVRPDLVITGNEPPPDWAELDPCPNCGSRPHDAPEGVYANGDPVHVFPHCWKCGHRPGLNQAVDLRVMREQFEAFKQFVRQSTPTHSSLSAPEDASVIADLQARMEQMQAEMAEMRGSGAGFSGPGPNTPSTVTPETQQGSQ